jgi:uncharacterized protein YecE (DUF72 family)
MKLFVGTSGFSYKEWKGSFYPEKLPAAEMLVFYAKRFETVEINNTFYRMPVAKTLAQWAEQVPPQFAFVLKAPQRITHHQKLQLADDSLAHFTRTAAVLGPRLGPLLFQLPPTLRKDVPRLREFLAALPEGQRAAFEFRHPSWFDEEVRELLTAAKAALCTAEMDDAPAAPAPRPTGSALPNDPSALPQPAETPLFPTADWGYLRLRRMEYGDGELSAWLARIRSQSWHEAFVFFKHEHEARGPAFAVRFLELAGST